MVLVANTFQFLIFLHVIVKFGYEKLIISIVQLFFFFKKVKAF